MHAALKAAGSLALRSAKPDARVSQSLQAGRADVDAVRCALAADVCARRRRRNSPSGIWGRSIRRRRACCRLRSGGRRGLLPLIEDRRKAYAFTLVLGRATTTGDAVGADDRDGGGAGGYRRAACDAVLRRSSGAIEQMPPMFCAVHHEGKRLYDLARAGMTVERPKRPVTIYALQRARREGDVVRMRVACSEGTYVRTLCEDLAAACGTSGTWARCCAKRRGRSCSTKV